ncbi:hypothetical protein MMYC01_206570 [Madurella mycetomatis]|uniref:2EXR domain-containing protein n=1 Tax=Madurella mycetomatis TaxID=100816 RepID=A0A175VW40_9PEZI|nr:hypothetical protein MMYC01_206570 [Madurella mycetomatis]
MELELELEANKNLDAVVPQFAQLRVDDKHPTSTAPQLKTVLCPRSVPSPPFSVTVTELPTVTPLFSPTGTTDVGDDEVPAGTFPYFPLLPAELRLKIWHFSFLPRTVELHTRRTHYADIDRHGGTPKWQSQSRNPAALSVNAEARAAALECYTVALPLAAPLAPNQTFERPGDLLQDSDRVLYLNLEHDMVVLLGDLHYVRLTKLLEWFRKMDVAGRRAAGARVSGLRRLAMSVAPWAHEVGAATLKAFALTVFADIEEFVLFMYTDRMPPSSWTGGPCVLEEASADADYYRRFVMGRGKQFRADGDWMVVGQHPMKVAEIRFDDGW